MFAYIYIPRVICKRNTDASGINAPLIIMFPPTTAQQKGCWEQVHIWTRVCTSKRHLMRKKHTRRDSRRVSLSICVCVYICEWALSSRSQCESAQQGFFYILHGDNYLWTSLPSPPMYAWLFFAAVYNIRIMCTHLSLIVALWGWVIYYVVYIRNYNE